MNPKERRQLLHDAAAVLVWVRDVTRERGGLPGVGRECDSMAARLLAEAAPATERVTWYCTECGSRHVQCEAWCQLSDNEADGTPQGTMVEWSQGGRFSNCCPDCFGRGDDGSEVSITEDRREAALARLNTRKRKEVA